MKKNDTGDFSILYVEASDDKAMLFQVISEQKKPVVIMLAEQAHVFLRPDDFTALKHVKRQLDLPVVFVIPTSGTVAQMAARNGFPVYLSIDALANALSVGQIARPRTLNRTTSPLVPGAQRPNESQERTAQVKKTEPSGYGSPHVLQPSHTSQTSVETPQRAAPVKKTVPLSLREGEEEFVRRQTSPLFPAQSGVPPVTPIPPVYPPPLQPHFQAEVAPLPPRPRPHMEAGSAPRSQVEAAPAVPYRRSGPLAPRSQVEAATLQRQPEMVPVPIAPRPRPEPESLPFHTQPVRASSRRFPLLLILLTLALVVVGLGSFLVLPRVFSSTMSAPAPLIVGHLAFSSSEQLSETSNQGIEDQLTVDLSNLTPPAAHMNYNAWLLGDKALSDPSATLLGTLQLNHGNAHLFYAGDAQHDNLLFTNSRFLVTEESSVVTPIAPTPDQGAWRYYGEFSTTPINSPDNPKHFSYLDHLRHLLAADPTLDELELPGGLNNWFFRNTGKVLEWVGSTREQWEETKDVGFIQRQTARALQYLDGNTFVGQDLPPNSPLLVNERLGRVGLVTVNGPKQEPPSYLQPMIESLTGLLQAGGSTPTLRKNIAALIAAMNNVQGWLEQVRTDAQKIMKMSNDQLVQQDTLALLNDMIDNATHAYAGQLDPGTNTTRQGVIWIHDHMQSLAILDITPFTTGMHGGAPQVMPTMIPAKAFAPNGVKR